MNCFISRIRTGFTLLVILMIPVLSHAWGKDGHAVVADVAQHYLNKTASEKVRQLLSVMGAKDMSDVASYADQYRSHHRETGPWHYVDIPLTADNYVPSRDCPDNNCVIDVINNFKQVLNNKSLDDSTRAYALAFLIHFVGDLHQPLHASNNNDKGGNEVGITFFGHSTNLHHIWDTNIITYENLTPTALADTLLSRHAHTNIKSIDKGSIIDWALQSHSEAQKVAYGKLPESRVIGEKYMKVALPVVNKQLYRAGVRLAYLLNQILG